MVRIMVEAKIFRKADLQEQRWSPLIYRNDPECHLRPHPILSLLENYVPGGLTSSQIFLGSEHYIGQGSFNL